MTELSREAIVETLKREALTDPETGWLSGLERRGLEWNEQGEIIVVGNRFGSVDIGHLAAIVKFIAEEHAKALAAPPQPAPASLAAEVLEEAALAAFNDRSIQGLRRVLIGNWIREHAAKRKAGS